MGAGASAASMPLAERRVLYEEMRNKYTRDDLNELAEEEKQAWLEVMEEQNEVDAAVMTEAEGKEAEGTRGVESAKGDEGSSLGTPEVTAREAAEAAAAMTGASSGRKSAWDLSGKTSCGVKPQEKMTRMSHIIAAESEDIDGGGESRKGIADDRDQRDESSSDKAADVSSQRHRRKRSSLPAWKKTAEELETPNELCVGDVVRARDNDFNGMWFEGVLTAILDEKTFEVELTGDEDSDGDGCTEPHRVTVGMADLVRVMPWFCIEVGDMVECQLDGTMCWARGTVVNVARGLYDVALESDQGDCKEADVESDPEDDDVEGGREDGRDHMKEEHDRGHVLYGIPDNRIRKIISGRQAAARRWKKMYLASCLTSGLGRILSSRRTPCDDE